MKEALRSLHRRLWATAPSLVAVAWLELLALCVLAALLIFDPRTLGGQPLWLKPVKFAASTAIYGFTLAWVLTFLGAWPRAVRWISGGTAFVMALEVGLISLQAGRGVKSHFNVGTPLDAAIFSTMGVAIVSAWVLGLVATMLLFRRRFEDAPALGTALRMGMVVTSLGAILGGAMTSPNAAQREAMARGDRVVFSGGHAVGAPEDAAGMPLVGWSTQGGDLRVPHFFGLHALQALPLAALLVTAFARRRHFPQGRAHAAMRVLGGAYLGGLAVLTLQALRGEPLLSPGPATVALAVSLGVASLAGIGWVLRPRVAAPAPAIGR